MTSNLVKRLRNSPKDLLPRCHEAADRIEALEQSVASMDGHLKNIMAQRQALEAENARLWSLIKLVDDDIRCHLRQGEIESALLRRHAVAAVRAALGEKP